MTKILVIEDDVTLLDDIIAMLKVDGYDALGAPNGKIGINLAYERRPDLLICDITMPEMDGFQVLQHIQKDQRTASIPFIFLSAITDPESVRRGMNLGADDFLAKPFDPEAFLQAIKTRLRKQNNFETKFQTTLNLLRKNISYALPHELRTPLTHILGFSDLMMTDAACLQTKQIQNMSKTIFEAGQRLQRMFENYLVYAQIELIKSDPLELTAMRNHITPDVGAIIGTRATAIAAEMQRTNDLKIELCNMALNVAQHDLEKIIDELVSNAFKFSKPGCTVEITMMRTQKTATIVIADHGWGMEPEQLEKIGAYIQFDRKLHEQQGLGLGLIIAKNLAELHRATFHIDSQLELGTKIHLTFPL